MEVDILEIEGETEKKKDGFDTGVIVAIVVVAGLFVVAIIAFTLYFYASQRYINIIFLWCTKHAVVENHLIYHVYYYYWRSIVHPDK